MNAKGLCLLAIVATLIATGDAASQECHYYDHGSTIDVLALYTEAARLNNSSNDIDAYIQINVATMNTILENSLAYPRIRVVHTEEVAYDESGLDNVDVTIDRMLDPYDGYLDGVHALRDAYQADIVALFVDCVNCGGVAACNHGDEYILDESGGFTVLASDWAVDAAWGFAHEVGHIMGCGHNRDCESSPGHPRNCRAYDHSYGWDYIGESGEWNSTVMSYGPTLCGGTEDGLPCDDDSDCPEGQTCEQVRTPTIPFFANPDVYFDGYPTGVPIGDPEAADNVSTINTAAFLVANYRERSGNIWVDFYHVGTEHGCFEHPYNTLAEGLANVPEGGNLIFKAGSTPETGVINKDVTLLAYGGSVIIGE